jgi:hypothetical protein
MTMLREAPADGKPGPVSIRRVLALFFSIAAIGLLWRGFSFSATGWFVFVPGIACLVAVLLLLFFTTWADISELASKIGSRV